jgi:hypothetical protein
MKTPFLGGGYVGRSRELVYNECINLYLETVETHEGKDVGALYNCPGYTLLTTLGTGPVRAEYLASNGVLYVLSGSTLYSVNSAWAGTALGNVGSSSGYAKMVDNGTQLLVIDGTGGWCYTFGTGAYAQVLPGVPDVVPTSLCFQDGFAVVNNINTNQWYQSNLNDFTTWSALNFSSADSTPDQIVAMFDIHREVWLFKQNATEVWVNAGLPGFAFQRLQGVAMPCGCVAPATTCRVGDTIVWLGQDEQGQGVVYESNGYSANPISTYSINIAIQGMSKISDAVAYAYQDSGHVFYVITFPTGNLTFVWDVKTRLWHRRAAFVNGLWSRHQSNCFAFVYGTQVIGDYASGNLYALSTTVYTDNGAPRKWLRTWRALPPEKQTFDPFRFDALQIDCMTGIGVPDGTDPQFMLRWSDDGGYTWSNEQWTDGNQPGATGARIRFTRLGSTKRSGGLDRIFELSGVDPVPQALIGADLDGGPT